MANNIKKIPDSYFEPLDQYEADVIETMEQAEINPGRTKTTEELRIFNQIKEHQAKKRKAISLRVPEYDLEKIKSQALDMGVPYQTLLVALIHQAANSNIEINLAK